MRRVVMAVIVAGAVALVTIGVARMFTPGRLPVPSRATAVVPQCPASINGRNLFGKNPFSDILGPAEDERLLSARLEVVDQTPLWCGHATEEAYRFVSSLYWNGESLVTVTVARRRGQWTLNAAEHTPSTFAAAAPVRPVLRRVSDAEIMVLRSALGADAFWQLPGDEPRLTPEQDPIGYHGPSWFLEGRSGNGYHSVLRGYNRIEVARSVHALLAIAGFDSSLVFRRIRMKPFRSIG